MGLQAEIWGVYSRIDWISYEKKMPCFVHVKYKTALPFHFPNVNSNKRTSCTADNFVSSWKGGFIRPPAHWPVFDLVGALHGVDVHADLILDVRRHAGGPGVHVLEDHAGPKLILLQQVQGLVDHLGLVGVGHELVQTDALQSEGRGGFDGWVGGRRWCSIALTFLVQIVARVKCFRRCWLSKEQRGSCLRLNLIVQWIKCTWHLLSLETTDK